MPLIHIESLDDPRLSPYRDLPKSNPAPWTDRFIVEGKLLVERLAASHYAVESVVVDERRLSMVPAHLSSAVPVFVLPPGAVEQLIGFNFHRGILACGRRRPLSQDVTMIQRDASQPATYVVCVDVQDPTNLGGILRNCAAFDADAVLLGGSCADPFSRRVLRVSMGTAFRLSIGSPPHLLAELVRWQDQHGIELVAAVLDPKAEPLESAVRTPQMALLIGNEGQGLPEEWRSVCRRRITLAMARGTDSLNVAAATAVFLYHFTRVARTTPAA
jgi:tRNA G18 (ribose-2'-O)-methylase SpoU